MLFSHNVPVLLQVLQSLRVSETLSCTRPKTCPCSCSCSGPQTESQVKVTFSSQVEITLNLGFGKCWNGTSSVGPLVGLISITAPWCLFMGARFNLSWQLKQSCHSLEDRKGKFVRKRNFIYREDFCLTQPVHTIIYSKQGQHRMFFFDDRSIFT